MKNSFAGWISASWTIARVLLAILFVLWCVLHLRPLDTYLGFRPPRSARIPGLLLIVAGGGLVLWCGGILASVGIFESRGSRLLPRQFVATGPFRYIRNPMSLGATAFFAGFGLWLRSFSVLLFSGLLFLIFHLVVVRFEEPGLEKRFGNSYVDYTRTVGRWIPKRGSSQPH